MSSTFPRVGATPSPSTTTHYRSTSGSSSAARQQNSGTRFPPRTAAPTGYQGPSRMYPAPPTSITSAARPSLTMQPSPRTATPSMSTQAVPSLMLSSQGAAPPSITSTPRPTPSRYTLPSTTQHSTLETAPPASSSSPAYMVRSTPPSSVPSSPLPPTSGKKRGASELAEGGEEEGEEDEGATNRGAKKQKRDTTGGRRRKPWQTLEDEERSRERAARSLRRHGGRTGASEAVKAETLRFRLNQLGGAPKHAWMELVSISFLFSLFPLPLCTTYSPTFLLLYNVRLRIITLNQERILIRETRNSQPQHLHPDDPKPLVLLRLVLLYQRSQRAESLLALG